MKNKFDEILLQINITRLGLDPVRLYSVDPATAALSLFILENISDEVSSLIEKIEMLKIAAVGKGV